MALLENKKVGFDYEILEKLEAGVELLGMEVKSLRGGRGSLLGARVLVRGGEAYVIGFSIPAYQTNNVPTDYTPDRNKKLLLTKKEISRLVGVEKEKGLTIVPISMYNKGRKLKMAIAIVRGKKKYDKRETLKKKDSERDVARTLKNRE